MKEGLGIGGTAEKNIDTETKKHTAASNRLARRCGFKHKMENDGVLHVPRSARSVAPYRGFPDHCLFHCPEGTRQSMTSVRRAVPHPGTMDPLTPSHSEHVA